MLIVLRVKKLWLPAFLLFLAGASFAVAPQTFARAKFVAGKLFDDNRKTLYCGCEFDNHGAINLDSCGMQSAANKARAHRVEWEHMMPAENFGRHFACWRQALCEKGGKSYRGRRCCQKIDAHYRRMEAELYNLWPAVGIVNQARSNYRFSGMGKRERFYGCDFTYDSARRQVEPRDIAKGIVARANLFVADHYKIRMSDAQRRLFIRWNRQFPPGPDERLWAGRVAAIEGYPNPYITAHS